MTKNYVLKPIYNDENECINDTLSHPPTQIIASPLAMEVNKGYNRTINSLAIHGIWNLIERHMIHLKVIEQKVPYSGSLMDQW